ncbi:MAG: DciA family protein [Gammaproteobacteria bacterium]|nr:DciA family protein [Gammaproteobacteria bacterium]
MREYTLKDAIDPNHPTSAYVGLRPLMLKIEANRQHLQIVRSMLPSDCGEHCIYVSRTPTVMTLIVDSSTWATQIRLDAKRLLNELQQLSDYVELKQVRVRVSRR